MEKIPRRKYNPRGERREYAVIRIDEETLSKLKAIAAKLKIPVIEAMQMAVEKLQNDLPNEVE
jgi:antitoxin component of RelBE/YafQ-DinJ toxin-antitoxin module